METSIPSSPSEPPKFDINQGDLISQLSEKNCYNIGGLKITRWGDNNKEITYFGDFEMNNNKFLGILNASLQKDGYGKWEFPNGEKFFGMFLNDTFNKHGLYYFPPKANETGQLMTEYYFGLFKNGKKFDHGVYLWLKENNGQRFDDFDNTSFDCYIGKIGDDRFTHGTYLIKKENEFYLYHGGFNTTTQKVEGNHCYFYNAQKDSLIYGKIINAHFVKSYYASFDEEGELKLFFYTESDKDGNVVLLKPNSEIQNREKIIKEMSDFRNIILCEDYFTTTFDLFKNSTEYLRTNLKPETFNSTDSFADLMQVSFEFNKAKIYNDIENVLNIEEKEKSGVEIE